jgi:MFS family permease
MVPLLIISEKNQQQKNIMRFSVLLLVLSQVIFWFLNAKFWGIIVGLILFFTGFNILEASLPSIISKLAPKNSKGAAMGVYSTAQFLGPMLGGVLAGVIFKHYGLAYIFILGLLWSGLWLLKLLKDY